MSVDCGVVQNKSEEREDGLGGRRNRMRRDKKN